jgi:hypothetical protein
MLVRWICQMLEQRAEAAETQLTRHREGLAAEVEKRKRLARAAKALLTIGKRTLENPKYDGYFQELKAALLAFEVADVFAEADKGGSDGR